MSPESGKLYQDPLYGAKVLTPLAVAIIDAPEFQRLAGLQQLGFSSLVYRGAVHTRLQHSIGTYFVCRTILRRIVQNHERLGLEHPGSHISDKFRQVPSNSDLPSDVTTHQSKWRGLTEVVSAAALLHDLGHVPFGHTLEDEFTGIYRRHDSLAGPRLHEMMFNDSSGLADVFLDSRSQWLQNLLNSELRRLIYVLLNWKDDIDGLFGFDAVLDRKIHLEKNDSLKKRLEDLRVWHKEFAQRKLFHPFMSDIVGNTICADLLDYLPRDRQHLGMEPRLHTRLQRYLTIREGTLYKDEGLRVSIMVTRHGKGGQRRDVATAVLDIMRERYEMAERVYYHHKKAAASAMLAKLVELAGSELKPRDGDGEKIYPAPWSSRRLNPVPHMAHLSDQELLDYLGKLSAGAADTQQLRTKLHISLRFRRAALYQTLLVVDTSLAEASSHSAGFIIKELRGDRDNPSSVARNELEASLAKAAGAVPGDVLIYCPPPSMRSKVVDARLEIRERRVLPLRVQTESFAYCADIEVLQRYYNELWRAYVFVAPEIFDDRSKCEAVVNTFCSHFGIPNELAYRKVRKHDLTSPSPAPRAAPEPVVLAPEDNITLELQTEKDSQGEERFLLICRNYLKGEYNANEAEFLTWYRREIQEWPAVAHTRFLDELEESVKETPAGNQRRAPAAKATLKATLSQFLENLAVKHKPK
jgi:HD superfamily phosphohydrolase